MIIMSNNQWKCDDNKPMWAEKGLDCSSDARTPFLVKAYLEVMPDILGLQEVSRHQAELMMEQMKEVPLADGTSAKYEYIFGADTPLVYRYDKYKVIETGFFRYDEEVPGLEGCFNNGGTKSYAWGVFADKQSHKRIAVMSTHLWWKTSNPAAAASYYQAGSNEARAYQIKLAMARLEEIMAKYGCPGVIMGDFNASLDSLCLEAVFENGWQEVHDLATGDKSETRGHHWCGNDGFGRRDDGGKFSQAIDHIVVKNLGDAEITYFRRLEPEWFDPISDHYPLYIELKY